MSRKEMFRLIIVICVVINILSFVFGFGFPGADLE